MGAVRLVDTLDRLRTALAGRYTVEREIGRGGMAIVFLAKDLRHDRDVAIKVLRPEFSMALSADRFLREIQIEAQLKHPYILPLFDSGDADGVLYYIMPYIAGKSLQDRLNHETQLPLEEALKITADIAEALSYAHARGVVHRDVKPGNILLDENHALLADFGIARAITELGGSTLSESGIVVGTPEYMSPEQCSDRAKLDGRSDIYALGCVLYQMLSGEPPFTGPTAQAIIARHLQERPRSLRVVRSSIPEHVEEAIEVALAKVPADRFTTALQFVAALGLNGKTASAIRRARGARRKRKRRVLLIAAVLPLAAALGWWRHSVFPPQTGSSATGAPPLSSIAVLYLQDRSESGKLEHLAAGLTEDLIDRLAAVPALRVISPDGVRPYRGKDFPLDSIAKTFHVGTVVTGTLSGAAERLRASIRLTDAINGVQLFSGTFEKPLGNILDLRDTLADELARQLRTRLGEAVHLEERRAGTNSSAAWNLVRQAEQLREENQALLAKDSTTSNALYRQADSLLAEAEGLDEEWADPTILRGWLAYDQADHAAAVPVNASAGANPAVVRWINTGVQHANRALKKAPNSSEAHEVRGSLIYRGWALTSLAGAPDTTSQLERAESDLRAAVRVSYRHQARALSTLSAVQQLLGKLAEANLSAQRAYETDAYLRDATAIVVRLFHTSLYLERYAEAATWCERGRRTFPRDWRFLMCRLSLLGWSPLVQPDLDQAWKIMEELDSLATPDVLTWLHPQMTMMVATVLARAGLRDSAERLIVRASSAAPADTRNLYYEALVRVRLGQSEKAAALLHELVRPNPNLARLYRRDPAFASLWNDPRLAELR